MYYQFDGRNRSRQCCAKVFAITGADISSFTAATFCAANFSFNPNNVFKLNVLL